jgi:hypothetical protein
LSVTGVAGSVFWFGVYIVVAPFILLRCPSVGLDTIENVKVPFALGSEPLSVIVSGFEPFVVIVKLLTIGDLVVLVNGETLLGAAPDGDEDFVRFDGGVIVIVVVVIIAPDP